MEARSSSPCFHYVHMDALPSPFGFDMYSRRQASWSLSMTRAYEKPLFLLLDPPPERQQQLVSACGGALAVHPLCHEEPNKDPTWSQGRGGIVALCIMYTLQELSARESL